MVMIIDELKFWIALLGGVLTFLGLLWKYGSFVGKFFKSLVALFGMPSALSDLAGEVLLVKKEVLPNGGGSLNDAVRRIERETVLLSAADDLRFRRLGVPAFYCDLDGVNTKVSDAYLEFLGLRVNEDLTRVDWLQFIHVDDRDAYLMAFQRAAGSRSDFSYPARFLSSSGCRLGKWMVRADIMGDEIYYGRFVALDDVAKGVAEEMGF